MTLPLFSLKSPSSANCCAPSPGAACPVACAKVALGRTEAQSKTKTGIATKAKRRPTLTNRGWGALVSSVLWLVTVSALRRGGIDFSRGGGFYLAQRGGHFLSVVH